MQTYLYLLKPRWLHLLTLWVSFALGVTTLAYSSPTGGRSAPPATPGNYVFQDNNQNGIFDGTDVGIAGVRVYLYQSNGVFVETATTTSTGQFSFTSTLQASSSYDIRIRPVDAPTGLKLSAANQGSDDAIDSDASMVGSTAVITANTNGSGQFPSFFGFGYQAGDPDLIITKTSNSFSVTRGATSSFAISVSNVGGSDAAGVTVKDTLDPGMGYVSSSPAATTVLLGNGQVELTWGGASTTLAAGAALNYTLTVTANADGVLTNIAAVTATTPDATPRNNVARACFTVPVKLCQGEAYVTSLSANLTNVEWFRDGVSVGTGNSLTIVTAGTYSYTSLSGGSDCGTSSCCPILIYDGSVVPPTLVASATAICNGQTASLTASNCVGTLAWSTGAADNGLTSITVAPTVTTTYSVTCTPTAANACPASSSITITVNPSVTATVASATICDGLSTTLTANAAGGTGFTYAWTPTGSITGGQGTASIAVAPSATTTYSVVVTNSDGCSTTTTATVTVNPAVTAVIGVSPSNTICDGTTVTLTATGGAAYRWSTGEVGNTITVQPGTTTVYSVTATSADQCAGVASTTITVNPAVTATVASATICDGLSTTLTANAAGGSGFSYAWAPVGTISGSTTASAVTVNPRTTTTYSVTVTNSDGCSTTATATVTVNPAVTATVASATICDGLSTTLTANASGGTGFSYAWTPAGSITSGQGTASIAVAPTTTTTYSVVVTNSDGCSTIATATVTVNPAVTATVASATICDGLSTTLTANAAGGTGFTYAWTPTGSITGGQGTAS
ncbi:SdrD B-like domain-containing protein, partial [Fibrella sp. WM1]|uniref:Ig-like domain-containing protein n=1 Tax=Fibrella musci TaxID=3242485 RepID=UPI003522F819